MNKRIMKKMGKKKRVRWGSCRKRVVERSLEFRSPAKGLAIRT